jgi:hypothetical protein
MHVRRAARRLLHSAVPSALLHFRGDRHRIIVWSELTHNAYRGHLILEYEVAKYDGDVASPNVYVPISCEHMDHKIRVLPEAYAAQRGMNGRTGRRANGPDLFLETSVVQSGTARLYHSSIKHSAGPRASQTTASGRQKKHVESHVRT